MRCTSEIMVSKWAVNSGRRLCCKMLLEGGSVKLSTPLASVFPLSLVFLSLHPSPSFRSHSVTEKSSEGGDLSEAIKPSVLGLISSPQFIISLYQCQGQTRKTEIGWFSLASGEKALLEKCVCVCVCHVIMFSGSLLFVCVHAPPPPPWWSCGQQLITD